MRTLLFWLLPLNFWKPSIFLFLFIKFLFHVLINNFHSVHIRIFQHWKTLEKICALENKNYGEKSSIYSAKFLSTLSYLSFLQKWSSTVLFFSANRPSSTIDRTKAQPYDTPHSSISTRLYQVNFSVEVFLKNFFESCTSFHWHW